MSRELQGSIDGTGLRVAIVVARFNRAVTTALLEGALEGLRSHGVADDSIEVFHVPGAFEITLAADRCAATGRFAAIVCLGAVVRGETPHFEFISREVSRGVSDVACRHAVPLAFGVLTTDTMEQALARSGQGHGNKGFEAAITALEMVGLLRQIEELRTR
jgi:6,7-dimethyl-8-ribityllumazine synthase